MKDCNVDKQTEFCLCNLHNTSIFTPSIFLAGFFKVSNAISKYEIHISLQN